MGKLSDLLTEDISMQYTNHCIRVMSMTQLSKVYNPHQVMSVTGHKSLQSLAIYQRVHADEKMSMGMSLTYSLLNPEDTLHIKQSPEYKALTMGPKYPAPFQEAALQQQPIQNTEKIPTTPEKHALDPGNKNIVPLESALQPYVPPDKAETPNQSPSFDILQLMSDLEGDNDIMLAAS